MLSTLLTSNQLVRREVSIFIADFIVLHREKNSFFMCLCLLLIHIWSVIPRAWCLSPNFNGILKCVLRQTNDETWYCSWMPFCFIVFTYTWSEENLINHTDLSPIPHSIPNSGSDTRYKYSTVFNWDSA